MVHGADFISPDFPLRSDPHGHGTQIAGKSDPLTYLELFPVSNSEFSWLLPVVPPGIIAGREFGVSRVARVVDVRVMDADGTGWTDIILAGLDYAVG